MFSPILVLNPFNMTEVLEQTRRICKETSRVALTTYCDSLLRHLLFRQRRFFQPSRGQFAHQLTTNCESWASGTSSSTDRDYFRYFTHSTSTPNHLLLLYSVVGSDCTNWANGNKGRIATAWTILEPSQSVIDYSFHYHIYIYGYQVAQYDCRRP